LACYCCACINVPTKDQKIEWIGTMQDTVFLNFLKVDFPVLDAGDTLIQIEFLYDLSDRVLYLIHKKQAQIHFSYRRYDTTLNIEGMDTTNVFETVNEWTGDPLTWKLLEQSDRVLRPDEWKSLLETLENKGIPAMPEFISDFVIGGSTTLLALYSKTRFHHVSRWTEFLICFAVSNFSSRQGKKHSRSHSYGAYF